MDTIEIFTDGGCRRNDKETNIGGWGVLLRYKGNTKEMWGGGRNTTNNIQELTGVIKALGTIKTKNTPIIIYSDSQYVVKGITEWVKGWVARGWTRANGSPVLNKGLWKQILELVKEQDSLTFQWVRGHSTNEGNNRADELANRAMDELEGAENNENN